LIFKRKSSSLKEFIFSFDDFLFIFSLNG